MAASKLGDRHIYSRSVEKVANCIVDPVARLRYLTTTAPLLAARERRRRGRLRRAMARHPWVRFVFLSAAALVAAASVIVTVLSTHAEALPAPHKPLTPYHIAEVPATDVWLVEKNAGEEIYSNGLRIDDRYQVSHTPRSYLVFPADRPGPPVRRTDPAGIVFHTTESHQVPFSADRNNELRRVGESLLQYVQRKFAYNFLIDRFGRVFRVVAETDAADHAGYSVWADDRWLYVNLNAGFLGVSFEGQTEPGQTESGASPAQIRSAAMLTEMLRSRYRIPSSNCVTHAQVSVNPSNLQVGYHTDWASGFPFRQLGLPDNYTEALPAIWAFGFTADAAFRQVTGERMAESVDSAEDALRSGAAAEGCTPQVYRKRLQQSYRRRLAALR